MGPIEQNRRVLFDLFTQPRSTPYFGNTLPKTGPTYSKNPPPICSCELQIKPPNSSTDKHICYLSLGGTEQLLHSFKSSGLRRQLQLHHSSSSLIQACKTVEAALSIRHSRSFLSILQWDLSQLSSVFKLKDAITGCVKDQKIQRFQFLLRRK